MEKITELLNKLEDLGKLIPELSKVTDCVQWLIAMAVRIGPLCILVLGLIYLLIPPKEANHKAGYRTYFGMGSVRAWRFTQLIAGIIMTVVGLILFLIARKAVQGFDTMDLMEMGKKAFDVIKGQVVCAAVIYVFMMVLTFVMFDRKGNPRFAAMRKSAPKNVARKQAEKEVEAVPVSQEEPEVPVTYERQGEQVITADDIVIEGLD